MNSRIYAKLQSVEKLRKKFTQNVSNKKVKEKDVFLLLIINNILADNFLGQIFLDFYQRFEYRVKFCTF